MLLAYIPHQHNNKQQQLLEEIAYVGGCDLIDQIMLVGQDEHFVSAVVVVSPTALATAGLITSSEGKQLSKLLGPTPLTTGCVGTQAELDAGNALINT